MIDHEAWWVCPRDQRQAKRVGSADDSSPRDRDGLIMRVDGVLIHRQVQWDITSGSSPAAANWHPLEWPNQEREMARTQRVLARPEVIRAAESLAA